MTPCLTVSCLLASLLTNRQIEDWPYEKLFKRAELIVIVKPIEVRDANSQDSAKPPEDYLEGVATKFKLLHVVKGEQKQDKLEVVHFKLKKGTQIGNGPLLVSFHTKPFALEGDGWARNVTESTYMLFLKREKDERLNFVSGQFDPALSVKQILDPLHVAKE
jgi:hypothetical protein